MSEPAPLQTVILVCAGFGVLAFISGSAENIWRKVKLAGVGAAHMLRSKDKKFKREVRFYTFPSICRLRECACVSCAGWYRAEAVCRERQRTGICVWSASRKSVRSGSDMGLRRGVYCRPNAERQTLRSCGPSRCCDAKNGVDTLHRVQRRQCVSCVV